MKTTLQKLIDSTSIPAPLVRATVRQSGGWKEFAEKAMDVAQHGADSGFSGWTYYHETEGFTRRNRAAIAQLAEDMAAELGYSGAVSLVKEFRCLQDAVEGEIARALYGTARHDDAPVENALAWFALEEVARAYSDLIDSE